MSNNNKYNHNNSLRPALISQAQTAADQNEAFRQYNYKEYKKPLGIRNNIKDFDVTTNNLDNNVNKTITDQFATYSKLTLDTVDPYIYELPDKEYWDVRKKYTDEKGNALDLDEKTVMGKVYVGDEYFDYKRREYERDEALQYQNFMINQVDISTPVKKDFVKRNYPLIFELIRRGEEKKIADDFTLKMILLNGPKTDAEWRYIYKRSIPQYNQIQSNESSLNKATNLPWPYNRKIQDVDLNWKNDKLKSTYRN